MSQIIDRVMADIEKMSPSEKSIVAQCILSSLDTHSENDSLAKWEEIARKRYDELKNGQVQPLGWEDIRKKVTGE